MAGLVQKMTLVDQNSVFCFAGEYSIAREILEYLKKLLGEGAHPEAAWEKMRKHFSLNDHSGWELIFEAMLPVGNGKAELISKSIGLKKDSRSYRSVGEAVIAGSGAQLAREVLARSDHGALPHLEGKYELAVQRALHLVAELLDLDMRGGRSFDNDFGGFYEVAIWYGNRFKKIDGVQFVYWTIKVGEEYNSLVLDRILLQYYQGETLCVDEVLVDESIPASVSLASDQHFPIAKLLQHRIPTLSEGCEAHAFDIGKQMAFQHRLTIHCWRYPEHNGSSTFSTSMSGKIQSVTEADLVRVDESEVVIDKDTLSTLRDRMVSAMERSAATFYEKQPSLSSQEKNWLKRFLQGVWR